MWIDLARGLIKGVGHFIPIVDWPYGIEAQVVWRCGFGDGMDRNGGGSVY